MQLLLQIEGRININIANNIKFDAGDFILDGSGANEGTGTSEWYYYYYF